MYNMSRLHEGVCIIVDVWNIIMIRFFLCVCGILDYEFQLVFNQNPGQ